MANEHRGEVEVTIAGRSVVLRPTFEALVSIERELGQTLSRLYRRITESDLGVIEVSAIVRHGAAAAGEKVSNAEISVAMRSGLLGFFKPVGQFIVNGMVGGADPEDQEKNAAAPGGSSPTG